MPLTVYKSPLVCQADRRMTIAIGEGGGADRQAPDGGHTPSDPLRQSGVGGRTGRGEKEDRLRKICVCWFVCVGGEVKSF